MNTSGEWSSQPTGANLVGESREFALGHATNRGAYAFYS